jgi:hypothetical protein
MMVPVYPGGLQLFTWAFQGFGVADEHCSALCWSHHHNGVGVAS